MTTQSISATRRQAAIRASRADDAPVILDAMLALRARGEYDAMEPHQLQHTAERIAANPATCAVADVDGAVAGWVAPDAGDLIVLPPHRRQGIGRQLLAAGRAMAAADGQDWLRLWVRRRPEAEGFATACGLRHASSLWQMRLSGPDLAAAPWPAFPDGTAIRSLRPGHDDAPFVALVNRTFDDHPSPVRLTEEELVRTAAGFDPTSVLVVEDLATRAMVGFCRVARYVAAGGAPEGEIRLLGVDRPWRRRGLGRAVTAWGIAELRHRGVESVVLAVEGENTAAQRLYTNLGFRYSAEWPHWAVEATPAGDA